MSILIMLKDWDGIQNPISLLKRFAGKAICSSLNCLVPAGCRKTDEGVKHACSSCSAGGAVGQQLIPLLTRAGHTVGALLRSERKRDALLAMGSTPFFADALYPAA